MENWRYIDLIYAEPYVAQTFYEAVAEAIHKGKSPNTLIMLQPATPYVCIGYHQDLEKEIDLDYCKKKELPIIRRSQGGGATILDRDQVFYQIVSDNSEAIPRDVDMMFEKLLGVTVESYKQLGIDAEFKPLNDVVTNGRKISGNGAGLYKNTSILVGNIILDLPYDDMANILRVPDEKFKDKMAKSMREWVTSLKRELGYNPNPKIVKEIYTKNFQEQLDIELSPSNPSKLEWQIFNQKTKPRHESDEWLFMHELKGISKPGRAVKIAGEVKMMEIDYKAKKLIRLSAEVKGNSISGIRISGDFFAIPKESIEILEKTLSGQELKEETLRNVVDKFYDKTGVKTPGITPKDFVKALLKMGKSL